MYFQFSKFVENFDFIFWNVNRQLWKNYSLPPFYKFSKLKPTSESKDLFKKVWLHTVPWKAIKKTDSNSFIQVHLKNPRHQYLGITQWRIYAGNKYMHCSLYKFKIY